MKPIPLLTLGAALALGACQSAPDAGVPLGQVAFGGSSGSSAHIGVNLTGADLTDYARISGRADRAAMQRDWRAADRDLQAIFAANDDRRFSPHLRFFASNRMLDAHFTDGALSADEAEAAGRYAAEMLAFRDVRSDALNETLVGLKAHWPADRFEAAAARLLARAGDPLDCFDCRTDARRAEHEAYEAHYRATNERLAIAAR